MPLICPPTKPAWRGFPIKTRVPRARVCKARLASSFVNLQCMAALTEPDSQENEHSQHNGHSPAVSETHSPPNFSV